MKSFFTAVIAAVVLALAFDLTLDTGMQRTADDAFASSTGVRLPAHGNTHNLVGKDWYSATEH